MLPALRPRLAILSHRRGGAQTARTAPVPQRSPVPGPAASAPSSPNNPTPCSHGSAGLGKAAVSRWSLRASAQRCHGARTLSLRTGAVAVLGRAPLEEGSAGERFPERCERPLNPSSVLPRTAWCQLSTETGGLAAAAHLGLPAAKEQNEMMFHGQRGEDKRKRIWGLGMSELLWAVLSTSSHSCRLLCLIINA